MKRRLHPIIMVVIGFLLPLCTIAGTIQITKGKLPDKSNRKVHPVEEIFSKRRNFDLNTRDADKLLVLMIEFQTDDNEESTGDGTFMDSTAAIDYPITWGKPPHDFDYFTDQMEALKYYYLAASFENFALDYDIFPKPDNKKEINAYTLPNEMSYYNPGITSDLLVSRLEEYFMHSFVEADQDENIDFSDYSHFMLIHAGSDWQHDTFGDTPADIPSFFINVIEEEKMAVVHDGSSGNEVIIDHACCVPETITQDIVENTEGSIPEVYGYGLVNAVFAHEFGHSLGFVDLYNTRTFRPAVGYFDIMDSGGFGLAGYGIDDDDDDEPEIIYYVEGGFPVFPGAWSRSLAWEEEFRNMGIFKDVSELNFNEEIQVRSVGIDFDAGDDIPYFIKIPLSSTEYLLMENRQVDPDGDGKMTPVFNDDETVILYPTKVDTLFGKPRTYEYDFFLPGWSKMNNDVLGGGLVIWHIDEEILYEDDNFDNNSINIRHSRRAVKVVEADNIDDIGNPYSAFWRGTEYDPFFKYLPRFNDLGAFVGWDLSSTPGDTLENDDNNIHILEFSSTTKPAMMTNDDNASIFRIYDISSYPTGLHEERIMSFRIGTDIFDVTEKVAEYDSVRAVGMVGASYSFPTFPVIHENSIELFSKIGDPWANNFGINIPFSREITQPVIAANVIADVSNNEENLLVSDNVLTIVSPENSQFLPPQEIFYSSTITDAPMIINDTLLIISTMEKLFIGVDSLEIGSAKLAFNGQEIIAAAGDKIHFIDPENINNRTEIILPEETGNFYPVCYADSVNFEKNAIFIQNINGDIYKIGNNSVEEIFKLYSYSSKLPTQLALGNIFDDDRLHLVFGVDDRAFVITPDGSLAPGFPAYLEYKSIKEESYPRIIRFGDEPVLIFEEENQGFLAVDTNADSKIEYSFFWDKMNYGDQFYWDEFSQRLYFIYADSKSVYTCFNEDVAENPLIWSGYRNSQYSLFTGEIDFFQSVNIKLSTLVYPNPARNGEVRIRIKDAKEDINLKIFNIAGNMIFSDDFIKEESDYQDITWDTRRISSGVYFGIVKSGNEIKKVAIAIEN